MPRDEVLFRSPDALRPRRVGSNVRPALFLRHSHPNQDARFFRRWPETRIVARRNNPWLPLRRQFRLRPQRGNRRKRHRHGTRVSSFVLYRQHHHRRPRHVCAFSRFDPWQAVQPVLNGSPHQVVPRRVIFNLVPSVAEAVMCVQHRLVFVGFESPSLYFFSSEQSPQFTQPSLRPRSSFALNRFHQRSVAQIKVVSSQRRRLIRNFMCNVSFGNLKRIHDSLRILGETPLRP